MPTVNRTWVRYRAVPALILVPVSVLTGVRGWQAYDIAHSPPALCTALPSLDRLVVLRSPVVPGTGERVSVPRRSVGTNSAAVRAVARRLCGLQRVAGGDCGCAAITFCLGYRLVFSGAGRTYPAVNLGAGDCGSVSGLGPDRQIRPGFFPLIGRAIGLAHPTAAAFGD